jgi:tetratricopeptide (TPR) repeat protein
MRTRYLRVCFGLLIIWSFFAFRPAFGDEPKFQSLEQYTRIQIPLSSGASFRLVNGPGEATVTLDRVRPETVSSSAQWSDSRVSSVSAKALGLDKVEMKLKFHSSAVESFAYMQGGNLVVDLWSPGTASPEAPAPKTAAPVAVKKKAPSRKIASVKAEPARDYAAPLNREKDIFQKFLIPMPELRMAAYEGGFELPPRARLEELWEFPKADRTNEEGKEFELAKKLYQEKKYGLALKTAEISLKKKENSQTANFTLLRAFCYQKLAESSATPALAEKAEKIFQELAARRDENGNPLPMHRAIRLYFAQREYNKGNWLEALGHFEFLAQGKESSPDLPQIQVLLADIYGKVEQARRAERLYRNLVQTKGKHPLAKESMYRIADLLALEKNYARVDEQVEDALRLYPEHEKNRSEVLFQAGEANFWMGKYAKAEKYFRRYTEISSAQTNSALAWVRLGEIAEVSRGDVVEARGHYLRAKNGYPFSRGDLVATVRLARIDLKTEKEPQYVINSLVAMLLDKTIDSELKKMSEITLGQYYLLVGEVGKALSLAREGMAQSDGVVYELYKVNYVKALFAQLRQLNERKNFADALALYQREKKWFDLNGSESYRELAKTYSGLGLYGTSNEAMEKYALLQRTEKRGLASLERPREVSATKGRNDFVQGAYASALEHLPKDSPEPEVRAMIAVSAFRLGEKDLAYKFADQLLGTLKKSQLSDGLLEDLGVIFQSRATEEREFARGEREFSRLTDLIAADSEFIRFTRAEMQWLQKKHKPAAEAYLAFLEKFPKSERAGRARYHLGMSYIGTGKREEAVKQLTQLRDSGQGVWSESAKQELELMDWERKYSSVLRTLPPSGLGISN